MSENADQRSPAANSRPSVPPPKRDIFSQFAGWTIRATGGRWGFLLAFGSVVIWAMTGPLFHFSDNWQLVINTGTTIVTFLMVFLIQNAQNRESRAVHLKLDELIFALKRARNDMIEIEHLTEEQLEKLGERYRKVAESHHQKLLERQGACPESNAVPGDGSAMSLSAN
jgi:low affinity Fe/Cu permease